MKVELFVNLKDRDSGRVIRAGVYDTSRRTLPKAVEREVKHHRETGRKTVRILEEDSSQSSVNTQEEGMTTLDSQEMDIQTAEDTSSGKKRRKRK